MACPTFLAFISLHLKSLKLAALTFTGLAGLFQKELYFLSLLPATSSSWTSYKASCNWNFWHSNCHIYVKLRKQVTCSRLRIGWIFNPVFGAIRCGGFEPSISVVWSTKPIVRHLQKTNRVWKNRTPGILDPNQATYHWPNTRNI